jgi:ABC-type multidrug transport system fused ATPase/permease subunit
MQEKKQQFYEIKRFFNLMIPNIRKHIFIAFFAGLSGMLFNLASASILKGIYSSIALKSSSLVYKYVCFFILMLAGVFAYNCVCWKLYGSSSARITGGIRRNIVQKLFSLNLWQIENNHSADAMTLLTNDIEAVQGIYVNLRFYVTTAAGVLIPSVVVFHISGILALLIIIMGIMQLIVNLLVIKPLEAQSIKIRKGMSTINSTFVDVLQNNMSIRLYGSESFYMKVCKNINQKLYCSRMKLNTVNAVIEGVNICFGLLGYIVILAVGGALIGKSRLNLSDLLFITQMRVMMIQGILAFGNYAVQIQPAVVGLRKILALMDCDIEKNV